MKLKTFTGLIFIAAVAALFALAQNRREAFAAAEDFPRGALVYLQIADLPAFLKLWNESKFKDEYLKSENFDSFQNRHLGLKLASRWAEFNQASGFPIDLETLAGLAAKEAAIAVYDIGKLEFVFAAPVSDEVFAATKFAFNRSNFREETLPGGTTIYRAAIEADRGRQKQELIFTHARGRFILATSEKLLAQTLNNLGGAGGATSRLADEPAFKALSRKIVPQTATVWVDQAALNRDYYFKRYWLMSDIESLENIRAGIFDLAIEGGKLVERRRFLLAQTIVKSPVKTAQARALLSFLPAAAPFYRLQTTDDRTVDAAIRTTLFDRQSPIENAEPASWKSYDADEFQAGYYERLDSKFDEKIDEIEEAETISRRAAIVDFAPFVRAARPQSVLTFARVESAPAPLFAEFQRAAIFALDAPDAFDAAAFEAWLAKEIFGQVTISADDLNADWETNTENGATWRELKLPMLNREIVYARRGEHLILTNGADFLREILTNEKSANAAAPDAPASRLTVIDLSQRENAFDRVFAALAEERETGGFFTGNIASLLDSLAAVEKIESRENYSRGLLEQEIIVSFRQSD